MVMQRIWLKLVPSRKSLRCGIIFLSFILVIRNLYMHPFIKGLNTPLISTESPLNVININTDKFISNNHGNASLSRDIHIDQWQTVEDGKVFTYSAYLDARASNNETKIRIWAIVKHGYSLDGFSCHIWFDNEDQSVEVDASGSILPEQFTKKYYAVQFICGLPPSLLDPQSAVSVSLAWTSSSKPGPVLKLHHIIPPSNKMPTTPIHKFTVCLCGPLKFGISNVNHLIEWIELHRYFGADHFVLYNNSASSALEKTVSYYSRSQDLVEMLPWQLPDSIIDAQDTMKNFGHMALINDCLYRSMYKSEHVVFLDTDEFMVPKRNGTQSWRDMLQSLGCYHSNYVSFQNVFFKMHWPNDSMALADNDVVKYELLTQMKTRREKKIWTHNSRSKYMVRPEQITLSGVHMAHSFLLDVTSCRVWPADGILYHYREWGKDRSEWLEDKYMHKFRNEMVNRIKHVHVQFNMSIA